MSRKTKQHLFLTAVLFALFIGFTVLVATVDVQPIAPDSSGVGLATINQFILQKIGTHPIWYTITECIGIAALLCAASFAAAGAYQLISRKSLWKVDRRILVLGGFYAVVFAAYLFFEQVAINVRPILLDGAVEASYPSSHTLLVLCITVTAVMQVRTYFPERRTVQGIAVSVSAVMITATIAGRLLSGVHWLTDIVGSLLLSVALIALYSTVCAIFVEN